MPNVEETANAWLAEHERRANLPPGEGVSPSRVPRFVIAIRSWFASWAHGTWLQKVGIWTIAAIAFAAGVALVVVYGLILLGLLIVLAFAFTAWWVLSMHLLHPAARERSLPRRRRRG